MYVHMYVYNYYIMRKLTFEELNRLQLLYNV